MFLWAVVLPFFIHATIATNTRCGKICIQILPHKVLRRQWDASNHTKTSLGNFFSSLSWKIPFLLFQDFSYNNLLILFNIDLCDCKAFKETGNKWIILDVNPKTGFWEVQKFPKATKIKIYVSKKNPEWFGCKAFDPFFY